MCWARHQGAVVHISVYKILFLVVVTVIEHRHTNKYIIIKCGRYMEETTVQIVRPGESHWQGAVKLVFSEEVCVHGVPRSSRQRRQWLLSDFLGFQQRSQPNLTKAASASGDCWMLREAPSDRTDPQHEEAFQDSSKI